MEDEKLLQKLQDAIETVVEQQAEALERGIIMEPAQRSAKWAEGPMADIGFALNLLESIRSIRARNKVVQHIEAHHAKVSAAAAKGSS